LKPDHVILNLLKDRLSEMSDVLSLHYLISDGVINLWIIIREENFETEMRIAESLAELFRLFRDSRFDFMIVPKHDLAVDEYLPSGKSTVFSK